MQATGNILIVDDSQALLSLITSFLEAEGYRTFAVDSGEKGIDFLKDFSPDLILLDRTLPQMDGIEACKQIKQNPATAGIPIIFLTATSDTKAIVEGFRIGAVDYITKPFQKEELLARVSSHISLYQMTQKLNEQAFVLKQSEERLKELNATKDRFFSIIAHDLKNPLNNILELSLMLKENYKPNEDNSNVIDDIIEHLTQTAENTSKLLSNLLDWALVQRGCMRYNPENLNLASLANECIELFSSIASTKSITLAHKVDSKTTVFADKNMLVTLLRNLISNALKFTPKNGSVTVAANQQHGMVEVSVKDTGVGIEPEKLSHIFSIIDSKSTYGTDGEHGTGLGLILCKEFVSIHNGKIWAESKLNKGTRFTFTIPTDFVE
ncbi:MAG: hybrid sensor histidine kinase/response regulator [Tenuifilaceae bacterium]|jgi:signal transduction histidine kinase|nr:hybrid sensor histidine kinase/response regulator [Tenuifilaceae bacterium]